MNALNALTSDSTFSREDQCTPYQFIYYNHQQLFRALGVRLSRLGGIFEGLGFLTAGWGGLLTCVATELSINKIQKNWMIQGQSQRIKVKLLIKRVTMSIKFPCSLTVQLKSDSVQELKRAYEIKNGECIINQPMNVELQVPEALIKNRQDDKKITINVFMISNSGKVSAGFATLNLMGKEIASTVQNVQYLEKCPDKGAKIYYSYTIEVFRNRNERLDKTIISQLRLTERKDNDTSREKKKMSTYNSVHIPQAQSGRFSFEEKYFKTQRSPIKQINNANLTESSVEKVDHVVRTPKERISTNFSGYDFPRANKSKSKSKTKIKQVNSSQNIMAPAATYTPLVTRMSEQREDEEQLAKLREKLRNAEKNERNNAQAIKDIREQAEKRKNRIFYLQSQKQQVEQSLKIKQEKLKKSEKIIKDMNAQSEEFVNQIKSLKSQLELRESMSKEQIKKLEDKYKLSQAEREKITEEYNKVLKNYEENEKKFQTVLKEKERGMHDQRQKLNKKVEQLNATLAQKQSQIKDYVLLLEEANKDNKNVTANLLQSQQRISQMQSQLQERIAKIKALSQSVKQLEGDVEQYKEREVQKQQLKKKLNETVHLNTQLQEKIAKQEKTIHQLQEKVKEVQEDNNKKNTEKNQLNQKLTSLKKSYESLKNNEEIKTKESQSLFILHNSANSKIVDLKSKLEFQKKSMEEAIKDFEIRFSSLSIQKQNLQTEAEQLRWQLEKNHSMIQELNIQVRTFNERNYTLNEELIEKSEKIRKVEENNKLIQTNNDYLSMTVAELQAKKKENTSAIKELTNSLNESKKKAEKFEKELIDYKERMKILEANNKEKVNDLQKRLKEKDDALQARQSRINLQQNQIKQLLDDASTLKQQATTQNQQISHLRQIIQSNKKEVENQEAMILKTRDSDTESKRLLAKRQEEIAKKQKQVEELTKKISKITEQATAMYSSLVDNIENYLTEVGSSEDEIKWIPSSTSYTSSNKIVQLQLENIQKHNTYVAKNRAKYAQLALQRQQMQYSISKLTVQLEETKNQYELQLSKDKEKFNNLQKNYLSLQQEDKESIARYEEMQIKANKELESFRVQVSKITEEKIQLESQITILINQYESIKEENKELQAKIQHLKNEEQRDKYNLENKYQNLSENHDNEVEQYKTYILELEKKIMQTEKESKDRLQTIKRYQQELHAVNYEKDKKDNKNQELNQKISDMQNQIKQTSYLIKERQREIKKWSESYEQLNRVYGEDKEKYDELLYKSQEQNNIILDLSKEIDKLKDDNEGLRQKGQESQSLHKTKMQTLKGQLDRQVLEIKDLKEKLIASSSQIQLKRFMNKQLETSFAFQREQKEQLKAELEKKKNQIIQLTETNTTLLLKNKEMANTISQDEITKEKLLSTIQKQKINIATLRKNADEASSLNDKAAQLERQLEKLRTEKDEMQNYYERQVAEMKNGLKQAKKMESSKVSKEEQLRKKIKLLEKLLETDDMELTASRKKILQEIEREKRDYYSKNELLEAKYSQAEQQLENLKLKYKKEVDRLNKTIQQLEEQNTSKDFFIKNQQFELDNNQYRLNQVLQDKAQTEKQVERQRAKMKASALELQKENSSLKERLKKLHDQQSRLVIETIQRKVSKSKSKKLQGNGNEFQRIIVSSDFRQFQEILAETLREKSRV